MNYERLTKELRSCAGVHRTQRPTQYAAALALDDIADAFEAEARRAYEERLDALVAQTTGAPSGLDGEERA